MATTTTSNSRPTTIKAVDGFFVRKAATSEHGTASSLFKNFELVPSSWAEFQHKLAQLESSGSRNVKVVYLVRHAQGYHNLAELKYGMGQWEDKMARSDEYLDPDLTPFGIQDAKNKGPAGLQAELDRGMPAIERVVVSPLSRTVQTAQHFFAKDQLPQNPFVCLENCREVLDCYTFDKRRPLSELKEKFPDVDYSNIQDEADTLWSPTHLETEKEINVRAAEFLSDLFAVVSERNVVVVTHVRLIQAACAVTMGGSHPRPENCEVVPLVLERV